MHSRSVSRRATRKLGLSTAAVVALALVGAACSSSAGHSSSPSATSSATNTSTTTSTIPRSTTTSTTATNRSTTGGRLSAFRSCMGAHGVNLPRRQGSNNSTPPTSSQRAGSPGGAGRFLQPPAGVDPTKYRSALNACRAQIPNGGSFTSSGQTSAPGQSALHVVVYKVSGSPRSASVVYSDSGGANDAQVSVPHQITVRLGTGAFFSVTAVGTNGATIGCEVLIDGKTITKQTASSANVADCHGTTP
jgi:hypothetical protein